MPDLELVIGVVGGGVGVVVAAVGLHEIPVLVRLGIFFRAEKEHVLEKVRHALAVRGIVDLADGDRQGGARFIELGIGDEQDLEPVIEHEPAEGCLIGGRLDVRRQAVDDRRGAGQEGGSGQQGGEEKEREAFHGDGKERTARTVVERSGVAKLFAEQPHGGRVGRFRKSSRAAGERRAPARHESEPVPGWCPALPGQTRNPTTIVRRCVRRSIDQYRAFQFRGSSGAAHRRTLGLSGCHTRGGEAADVDERTEEIANSRAHPNRIAPTNAGSTNRA